MHAPVSPLPAKPIRLWQLLHFSHNDAGHVTELQRVWVVPGATLRYLLSLTQSQLPHARQHGHGQHHSLQRQPASPCCCQQCWRQQTGAAAATTTAAAAAAGRGWGSDVCNFGDERQQPARQPGQFVELHGHHAYHLADECHWHQHHPVLPGARGLLLFRGRRLQQHGRCVSPAGAELCGRGSGAARGPLTTARLSRGAGRFRRLEQNVVNNVVVVSGWDALLSCHKTAVGSAVETSCLEKKRKTGELHAHKIKIKKTTKKQK